MLLDKQTRDYSAEMLSSFARTNNGIIYYFPLALQVLDNDTSTALAADLLLQWPALDSLQKQSAHKLRKFFYAHNCRNEQKLLERLELIKSKNS